MHWFVLRGFYVSKGFPLGLPDTPLLAEYLGAAEGVVVNTKIEAVDCQPVNKRLINLTCIQDRHSVAVKSVWDMRQQGLMTPLNTLTPA